MDCSDILTVASWQVTEFMNLRRPDDFDDLSLPTVGEDVMTIHNSGPDLPNLTLLDVPGTCPSLNV